MMMILTSQLPKPQSNVRTAMEQEIALRVAETANSPRKYPPLLAGSSIIRMLSAERAMETEDASGATEKVLLHGNIVMR